MNWIHIIAEVGTFDGIDGYDLIWVAAVTTAVAAIWSFITKLVKPLYKKVNDALEWNEEFRRAWDGVPETSTHKRLPGVMERLDRLDGELHSAQDGEKSLKESVDELVVLISSMKEQVDRMEQRQIGMNDEISGNNRNLAEQMKRGNYNNRIINRTMEQNGIDMPPLIDYGE